MRFTPTYLGKTLPEILARIEQNRTTDPLLRRIATTGPTPQNQAAFMLQYLGGVSEYRETVFDEIAVALQEKTPLTQGTLAFRIMRRIEEREIKKIIRTETPEKEMRLRRLTDEGKTVLLADADGNFTQVRTYQDVAAMTDGETAIHWNPFRLNGELPQADMHRPELEKQMQEQEAMAVEEALAQQGIRRRAPMTVDAKNHLLKTQIVGPDGELFLLMVQLATEDSHRFSVTPFQAPEKQFFLTKDGLAILQRKSMESLDGVGRPRVAVPTRTRVREQVKGAHMTTASLRQLEQETAAAAPEQPQKNPTQPTSEQKPQKKKPLPDRRIGRPKKNPFLRKIVGASTGIGAGLAAAVGLPPWIDIFF